MVEAGVASCSGAAAVLVVLGATVASCNADPSHVASARRPPPAATDVGWPIYGGDLHQDHYSPLTQIDRNNVRSLKEVWRFDINERGDPETNPVIIGRTLYAYTPELKVIAL